MPNPPYPTSKETSWSVSYAMRCQEHEALHEAIDGWRTSTGKGRGIFRFAALEIFARRRAREQVAREEWARIIGRRK